ncbi:unnamed protein product [Soboliphyme baturini]|uniref:Uncharacterized protein n=1 Tax=Soboliphyme baturini TaxID=241478 RepID=A0A183IVS3_9BILA|nr:unnamed protein product [Soboliphyme baturini]
MSCLAPKTDHVPGDTGAASVDHDDDDHSVRLADDDHSVACRMTTATAVPVVIVVVMTDRRNKCKQDEHESTARVVAQTNLSIGRCSGELIGRQCPVPRVRKKPSVSHTLQRRLALTHK